MKIDLKVVSIPENKGRNSSLSVDSPENVTDNLYESDSSSEGTDVSGMADLDNFEAGSTDDDFYCSDIADSCDNSVEGDPVDITDDQLENVLVLVEKSRYGSIKEIFLTLDLPKTDKNVAVVREFLVNKGHLNFAIPGEAALKDLSSEGTASSEALAGKPSPNVISEQKFQLFEGCLKQLMSIGVKEPVQLYQALETTIPYGILEPHISKMLSKDLSGSLQTTPEQQKEIVQLPKDLQEVFNFSGDPNEKIRQLLEDVFPSIKDGRYMLSKADCQKISYPLLSSHGDVLVSGLTFLHKLIESCPRELLTMDLLNAASEAVDIPLDCERSGHDLVSFIKNFKDIYNPDVKIDYDKNFIEELADAISQAKAAPAAASYPSGEALSPKDILTISDPDGTYRAKQLNEVNGTTRTIMDPAQSALKDQVVDAVVKNIKEDRFLERPNNLIQALSEFKGQVKHPFDITFDTTDLRDLGFEQFLRLRNPRLTPETLQKIHDFGVIRPGKNAEFLDSNSSSKRIYKHIEISVQKEEGAPPVVPAEEAVNLTDFQQELLSDCLSGNPTITAQEISEFLNIPNSYALQKMVKTLKEIQLQSSFRR